MYLSLNCESTKIVCVFNNSLLASRKISDWSPDNNLSAKTKWQKDVTLMTSSNGNIFRVTGHLCREFTGSFDVFLDLHPNKRLSKQS